MFEEISLDSSDMETQINLGKVRPVDKGAWSAEATYTILDIVTNNKGSYMSKVGDATTPNTASLTDRNSWIPLADVVSLDAAIQEANANITQLAGESKLKDAEQDASIKNIEQVISQSNLNQTAQVSATGRKVVSLPKNASNGGMEVKLEGLTAQNLVTNGDFRNGVTGWTPYISSSLNLTETALQATVSNLNYNLAQAKNNFNAILYNKYYIKLRVRVLDAVCQSITLNRPNSTFYSINAPIQNQWYNVSGIKDANFAGAGVWITALYASNSEAQGKILEIDRQFGVVAINLTATFGAGNEPDLATCDAIFSDYFEGVKSFVPTGRVRSVGKNLFDGHYYANQNPQRLFENNTLIHRIAATSPALIRQNLKSGGTYTFSCSGFVGGANRYRFEVSINGLKRIDSGYKATSYTFTMPKTNSEDVVTLKLWAALDTTPAIGYGIANPQIEGGATATSYEPYTDTKLYIDAPELRSNGAVRDEIRLGDSGYELVKRVGVGTLSAEKAVNGDFSLSTGWTLTGTGWSISDGKARCNSTAAAYVRQNGTLTIGAWQKVKCTAAHIRGTSSYITGNAGATKPLSNGLNEFFIKHTGSTPDVVFLGANYEGTLDDVSVKELVPQDGAISDTSTFTELSDGTILYTLATPVVTSIDHAGILNSAENGTVYHEPVVPDAGIYNEGITVFNEDYPISELEGIRVHADGVDTLLDVSAAVIAADGLSFTHPSLNADDLVLFTYSFDKEKVNGLITATYYDSRVVEADTNNGKFYKYRPIITDGEIVGWTLTEV